MKKLLYNALIVNEDESFIGYIAINGDEIAMVGHGEPDNELVGSGDFHLVDCEGDMLMPGAVDSHVHFRDPGLTVKGDIATESRAAVAGGVTSYMEMPNTKPLTVTLEAWNDKMERAAGASLANYSFFIGATNDNLDTLLAADYTRVPGVKLFMGSSTGNMLVDSESMLDRLFASLPALIMVHAEDEGIIRANRADIEGRYPQGGAPLSLHAWMRSPEACVKATGHAVALARKHGARLHVAHVSTAAELEFFSPGDVAGKTITAETCPHYLLFTSADMDTLGARVKCNPAIKADADRLALVKAVRDGVIDTIATDHAPHLPADKEGDLLHAASGMPGVQFSLPVMLTMGFTPQLTARLTAHNPATLFGIVKRGFLRPGYKADIVRVKRLAEPHTVTDSDVVSRCGWTPYAGCQLSYSVVTTWVNGHEAYDRGAFASSTSAEPLVFNQSSQLSQAES